MVLVRAVRHRCRQPHQGSTSSSGAGSRNSGFATRPPRSARTRPMGTVLELCCNRCIRTTPVAGRGGTAVGLSQSRCWAYRSTPAAELMLRSARQRVLSDARDRRGGGCDWWRPPQQTRFARSCGRLERTIAAASSTPRPALVARDARGCVRSRPRAPRVPDSDQPLRSDRRQGLHRICKPVP